MHFHPQKKKGLHFRVLFVFFLLKKRPLSSFGQRVFSSLLSSFGEKRLCTKATLALSLSDDDFARGVALLRVEEEEERHLFCPSLSLSLSLSLLFFLSGDQEHDFDDVKRKFEFEPKREEEEKTTITI